MRLLLDTHIFLWFISGDLRLSESLLQVIRDSEDNVFLSVISVWEATINYSLSKLDLPEPPETYMPLQRQRQGVSSLPLDEASVAQLASLPNIHRDPFDRMLICQAKHNDMIIVTQDKAFSDYPVELMQK